MIRETLAATKQATFAILLPNPDRNGLPQPIGTGFFVSPEGWLVTAAHVITENNEPDGPIRRDLENAYLIRATEHEIRDTEMCKGMSLEFIQPSTDFALLAVDFEANKDRDALESRGHFPYIEVSSRELAEGEPVYSYGYPLSSSFGFAVGQASFGGTELCPRVTSAIVSSKREKTKFIGSPQDPKVYVLDKALNYGNSGGPIIAVETGKVHGLCSSFQPVTIQQPHLSDQEGNSLFIRIPSLYGVVSSLGNPGILAKLRECKVPLSER
jgi:hypothetical protein